MDCLTTDKRKKQGGFDGNKTNVNRIQISVEYSYPCDNKIKIMNYSNADILNLFYIHGESKKLIAEPVELLTNVFQTCQQ